MKQPLVIMAAAAALFLLVAGVLFGPDETLKLFQALVDAFGGAE